jgi:hypothetical protein
LHLRLTVEIERIYASQLPKRQLCVNEISCSNAAASSLTLMLYGEAALSVVRAQFPAATPDRVREPRRSYRLARPVKRASPHFYVSTGLQEPMPANSDLFKYQLSLE